MVQLLHFDGVEEFDDFGALHRSGARRFNLIDQLSNLGFGELSEGGQLGALPGFGFGSGLKKVRDEALLKGDNRRAALSVG